MAILAREGLLIDTPLATPPTELTLTNQPANEKEIEQMNAQAERELQLRNAHANVHAQGTLCDDKPWKLCNQEGAALSFLSFDVIGGRIFISMKLHKLTKSLLNNFGMQWMRH